jgi:apolipoprotein N-acyltransferase
MNAPTREQAVRLAITSHNDQPVNQTVQHSEASRHGRPPAALSRRTAVLLALVGGALVTLTVPPFGWWPLAIPGIAAFSVALRGARLRRRVLIALLFGCALYIPSLWWMTQFSLPGGIAVGVLEAVMTTIALTLVRTDSRRTILLTVPAAFIAADALRSLWPFGGLPLGGIDLGQADGPFAALAPYGGRLLIIGTVAVIGAALGDLLPLRRDVLRTARLHASGAATLAAFVALSQFAPNGTVATATTTRIAAVQGGGPLGLRATADNAVRTFNAAVAETERSIAPGSVDVILWPENVVDVDRLEGSPELATLQRIARERRAVLLAGITEDAGPSAFTNYQVAIAPDGAVLDRFDKVRRVPYGEFFPLRSAIESLGVVLPEKDAVAGSGPGVLRTPNATFAVLISYEGFFDDRSRGGVRAGGDIVLLPTNTASYTSSMVPTQQLAAAKLRARETGRWLVQASPTGYNAVIDDRGRLLQRTSRQVAGVLTDSVPHRRGFTPYVRFNDTPMLLIAAAALVAGWAGARPGFRRRRAETPPDE